MNLVLIGPSGAGKGTQIDKLISTFGLVHFCPGNLFREHINKCQGEHLQPFDDDKSETIRTRLKVFQGAITPLMSYYEANGKWMTIDAEQDVERVHTDITKALEALKA